jgi:hypothetical protein
LDQLPTFLVPCVLINELFSHDLLISGKVLIADDIVEKGREGYFEEWFEYRVGVVGQAPQHFLSVCQHLYAIMQFK